MTTQADLDLGTHKVVHDERVKEQNRLQRLLIRPEMGALVGAVAIFIFFAIVAPPFRSPEALATVLYASSTIGIMAVAVGLLMIGGEFDLSAGVAVTTSATRGVDALLQPASQPVARCGAGAVRVAGHRVLQRLPGDEDQDPVVPDHVGFVPDADRYQPGGDQAGHRAGRLLERGRHAGLRFGQEGLRVVVQHLRRLGPDHGALVDPVHDRSATYVLFKTRIGNWIFAVGGNLESARAVGVPVNKVKIGLFMFVGFAAWFVGMHVLFSFNTIQSGQGVGNEFLYIIAAVIGGCLLTGGYGTAIGTLIGAFIFGMVNQGIVYAGWNPDWFKFFLGAMLLFAVIANNAFRNYAAKR